MRHVIAYHDWATRRWISVARQAFVDRDDYLEGANAYAYCQASLRRSLREHCIHSWRLVEQWLSTGDIPDESASHGEAKSVAAISKELDLPDLELESLDSGEAIVA